jgi:Arc/MetJ-type ribon-helix-helix transcriptional regulator
MTIHVSKEVESSINAAVQSGRFPSVDDAIAAAWLAFQQQQDQVATQTSEAAGREASSQHKPIWEEILELTAAVPDEEWDKLPVDGAEQHDHYIYGTPKRPPVR